MPAKKTKDAEPEVNEEPGAVTGPPSEDHLPANERTQPEGLNEGGFKQVDGHGWSEEELAAKAESASK